MNYLHALCSLLNIQTSFLDDRKKLVSTSRPVLYHLIHLLSGHKPSSEDDESQLEFLYNVLKNEKLEHWLAPTLVAWNGILPSLKVYIPAAKSQQIFKLEIRNLQSPTNPSLCYSWNLSEFNPSNFHRVQIHKKEITYLIFHLPWLANKTSEGLQKLDPGYYHLLAQLSSEQQKSLLIVAPKKLPLIDSNKDWGLFSPLYALRSEHDGSLASLKELEQLQLFLKKQGGSFIGTLPLLAPVAGSSSFDPSPYAPSSRLFGNEIYLDIPLIARQMNCEDYYNHLQHQHPLTNLQGIINSNYVEYEAIYQHKKNLLKPLAEYFFAHHLPKDSQFDLYLKQYPEIKDYSHFRGDEKFHTFVQYQNHQQLLQNRYKADQKQIANLYLDFPVGVHPQGFDVQHFSKVFLNQATMGAPPDSIFSAGQNWGTRALHPQNCQLDACQYLARCFRHHLQYASLLRLDHVMSFHRLYMIPQGASAKDGAYIKYPTDILYALLCLEASKSQSQIIGEDLGTVPSVVREKMQEYGCQRMWVFELEFASDPEQAIENIPVSSLVSLNTHDMPPLALFYKQHKEALLPWLRYLNLENIDLNFKDFLQALVSLLARSKAQHFMINLEDIWGEIEPQNTPGVVNEKNWRKKNLYPFEEWSQKKSLLEIFEKIKQGRRP